ncbi:MAG: hypothetical protein ABIJ09_24095 [Pseudomonadota bacterium]
MLEDSTQARWRGLLGLTLIILALLGTLAVRLFSRDAAISDADLAEALRWLQERRQGAVIVVHPPWRDDVVERLRQGLGDADVRLAAPVHQGAPAGRLLLVEAGWSPGPAAFSALIPHQESQVGALRLRLFEAAAAASSAEVPEAGGRSGRSLLLDDIAALHARFELADRVVPCDDFDVATQTYRCPSLPEWNHVGPTTLAIGGRPRRCLWAHPITAGKLLIDLPWPRALKQLTVLHGLADSAAQAPGGKPVELELRADDRPLGSYTQRNEVGYQEHQITLDQDTATQRLVVEIRTSGDGARHFCIDLQAVDAKSPTGAPLQRARPLKQEPPLRPVEGVTP